MLTTLEARLWGLLRSHTGMSDEEIAVRLGPPVRARPREPRTRPPVRDPGMDAGVFARLRVTDRCATQEDRP